MAPKTLSPQSRVARKPARHQAGSTVRVRDHVHAILQQLSDEMGEPMQDIIEEAVEAFRVQRMFELHNRAYTALKADPQQWQQELEERRIWDAASADGLDGV